MSVPGKDDDLVLTDYDSDVKGWDIDSFEMVWFSDCEYDSGCGWCA